VEENKSLASMLASLVAMETVMDSTDGEITLEQCDAHFAQFKDAQAKTDRLIGYLDHCKLAAAQYADRAQQLKEEAQRWERRQEKLEEYALWCLEKYPALSGSDFELSARKNPASMKCDLTKSFSKSNALPESVALEVPEEYRDLLAVWVLKADKVKDDLKAGKALPFARLEQKTKLVTKPKLKGLKS
jgi:hypothetical protein